MCFASAKNSQRSRRTPNIAESKAKKASMTCSQPSSARAISVSTSGRNRPNRKVSILKTRACFSPDPKTQFLQEIVGLGVGRIEHAHQAGTAKAGGTLHRRPAQFVLRQGSPIEDLQEEGTGDRQQGQNAEQKIGYAEQCQKKMDREQAGHQREGEIGLVWSAAGARL